MRLNTDLQDIENDLPSNAKLEFPDINNSMKMKLTVKPARYYNIYGGEYLAYLYYIILYYIIL